MPAPGRDNMAARYTRTALTLHWLMAAMIIGMFPLGWYMSDLTLSPEKLRLYSYHKWTGITIFLLAALRLSWRIGHRPPPLPAAMPSWQRTLACTNHWALYVLLFVIPVSGWLMSSALGVQVVYLGLIPLPDLVAKNKELGEGLKALHGVLNLTLAALVLVHAGAALKHHIVERDDVLTRMLPFLKPRMERNR